MVKLSEAIRLGAMMKPQTHGALRDAHGTCALGAALDAGGCLPAAALTFIEAAEEASVSLRKRWDVLKELVQHPIRIELRAVTCGSVIVDLNDDYLWPRERIANWVQTIEDARSASDNGETSASATSDDAVRQTEALPVAAMRG